MVSYEAYVMNWMVLVGSSMSDVQKSVIKNYRIYSFISREILDIIRVSDWGVGLWSGQAEFLAEVVNMNGIQVIYKQFYRKGHWVQWRDPF